MSFERMARGVPGTEAGRTTASAVAPGKRTLTEALGPTPTGPGPASGFTGPNADAGTAFHDRGKDKALGEGDEAFNTTGTIASRAKAAPPIAADPALRLARAMVDEAARLRSATQTEIPCRASFRAAARPMPEPPPTTRAVSTFPVFMLLDEPS